MTCTLTYNIKNITINCCAHTKQANFECNYINIIISVTFTSNKSYTLRKQETSVSLIVVEPLREWLVAE